MSNASDKSNDTTRRLLHSYRRPFATLCCGSGAVAEGSIACDWISWRLFSLLHAPGVAQSGRFDEAMYAAEEVAFGQRLKRQGRFVILRECVTTSGRKLRAYAAMELLRVGLRMALGGPQSLRQREGLELWYGPRKVLQ